MADNLSYLRGSPRISKVLRELADQVDRGEVDHLVVVGQNSRSKELVFDWVALDNTVLAYGLLQYARYQMDAWMQR